jgi:hypothetical protein
MDVGIALVGINLYLSAKKSRTVGMGR